MRREECVDNRLMMMDMERKRRKGRSKQCQMTLQSRDYRAKKYKSELLGGD